MWASIILACGIANGEVTTDCRSFTPKVNVATEELCRLQVKVGIQVVIDAGWMPMDYRCINWKEQAA